MSFSAAPPDTLLEDVDINLFCSLLCNYSYCLECGGSLAGTSYSGNYDGTRENGYFDYNPDQSTTISG